MRIADPRDLGTTRRPAGASGPGAAAGTGQSAPPPGTRRLAYLMAVAFPLRPPLPPCPRRRALPFPLLPHPIAVSLFFFTPSLLSAVDLLFYI